MIARPMPTFDDYAIVIRPDEDTFVAYVPAISGCHAMGATRDEAPSERVGVFKMVAELAAEDGRELPPNIDEPEFTLAR